MTLLHLRVATTLFPRFQRCVFTQLRTHRRDQLRPALYFAPCAGPRQARSGRYRHGIDHKHSTFAVGRMVYGLRKVVVRGRCLCGMPVRQGGLRKEVQARVDPPSTQTGRPSAAIDSREAVFADAAVALALAPQAARMKFSQLIDQVRGAVAPWKTSASAPLGRSVAPRPRGA